MENEFLDRAEIEKREAVETEKKKKEKAKRAKQKAKAQARKPGMLMQILNGDFFTREFVLNNMGFIFFVMLLLLLTVAKGYYGKNLTKKVVRTREELNELTSDYFEAKARLENETRRGKLVEELAPRGLKETVNPTKVIRIEKKDE